MIKGHADKTNRYSFYDFYNSGILYTLERDTLDAAFIGTSQMFASIIPLDIWNQYGITSATFTFGSLEMPEVYFYTKEIFKYQQPKVLFVDASSLKAISTKGFGSLSWMKPSLNKYQAMSQMFAFEIIGEKIGNMWDVYLTHDSWKNLHRYDFQDYRERYAYMKNSFYTPQSVYQSSLPNYKENFFGLS